MAFKHGKNTSVLVGAYDLSTYFKDASVAGSVETAETTTYGVTDGAKTYVVGLNDATVSLGGLFDGDANAVDEVFAGILGTADVPFTVAFDGGLVLGARCVSGLAIATKYDIASPVADVVNVSADIQTDAGASRAVVLAPASSVSSTSNGTSVDGGASTANGGTAVLHVTANTRNGAITVKVQHSADNSTWADLATFSAVGTTTTTAERVSVATGTTVNRYLRATYTVAGSSGSATVTVTFGRR